ncbi:MAG: nitronate monooxygenase [Candidatus Eremiobacteraeota bacterium]|nr:nitronate monooxygenase [Candidatus Eremiobacteraeota bacterium]
MKRTVPFFESPIVLAPLGGPGTVELTAAACNARAFGSLACQYSDPERMRRDIARLRTLTDKPFGLNLFMNNDPPPVDADHLSRAHQRLHVYRDELGVPRPEVPQSPPLYHDEQMRVVLETRPQAFSFTLGIPSDAVIAELKAAGIYTIGTATTVEEAVALERAGIEAVCVQGAEAGGHRGTFLHYEVLPLIGTLALVPQVVKAVSIPVIAAGGIADGDGIAAVLLLGACAAQLGTAFLLADEAGTATAYRDVLKHASASDTIITEAFSGKPARGIANRVTRELADPRERAPYPHQNTMTRDIRNAAASQGRSEFLSLWAGQAFPLAREASAAEIIESLLAQTRVALRSRE